MELSFLALLLVLLLIASVVVSLSLLMCAETANSKNDQVDLEDASTMKKKMKKEEEKGQVSSLKKGGLGVRSSMKVANLSKASSISPAGSKLGSKMMISKAGNRSTDFKSNSALSDGGSAVKSTGSNYYATLLKQTRIKSVSQYGAAPKPKPK